MTYWRELLGNNATSSHKGGVISPAVSYNATTVASIGYVAHHANE
jgi:hypothetical protein